jgi:cytoskeletal protein CcmA (bactofilin family)
MYKKIIASILLSVVSLVFVKNAYAADDQNPGTILESGKTVQGDYFAANKSVQVLGTVNGDVYLAGGSVIVNGVVNGDVLAVGGNVYIGGVVNGNVRVAGGDITIMGSVVKNATVAGGTITWSPEAKVGGSVLGFTNNATLSGKVGRDVRLVASNVTLSQATVVGNLTYWSERDALITNGSKVTGETNHVATNTKANIKQDAENTSRVFNGISMIGSLITTIIIGLLMIKFLPRYVARGEEILHTEFGKSMLRGFFATILIPLVIILLFATILGIPLAFMLIFALIAYLYVARIFAIIAIGAFVFRLMKNKGSLTKSLFVGILIYYVLSMIPFVGAIVKSVVSLAALGAAISNDKRTWAMNKASKLV